MNNVAKLGLLAAVLLIGIVVVAPNAAAKDFIIQNKTGSPLLVVNGTTNNVGIGLRNPSSPFVVDGGASILGNLDLSSNNIQNLNQLSGYYGAACGAGEVVQDINDDGSFVCANVTQEVKDRWVNASGDTMTGNLDMSGNNITNTGYLGIGTKTPVQPLTVIGNINATGSIYEGNTLLSNKYVLQTTSVIAGTGLTGGGQLSTDRTLGLNDSYRTGSIYDSRFINEGQSNAVDDTVLDNSVSFTVNGLTVTGSGTSATFQNDVQIQGDLDVWGNITNTNINNLSVNGSLLPPKGYDNTFDVGSNTLRWRNGYFGGTIYATTVMQNGNQVIDTLTSSGPITVTDNGNSFDVGISTPITISYGGTGASTRSGARKNLYAAVNGTCPSGQVVQNATTGVLECLPVDTDSSNEIQSIQVNGNKLSLTQDAVEVYAPFANNSDTVDGFNLSEINWTHVAMKQGHIRVSDLGAADANLNMNNHNLTNVRSIEGGGNDVRMEDNVSMQNNSINDAKTVNFGGGMVLTRSGDDLCLGDQCNG